MKPIIICDLDGTLADIKHRVHYITPPSSNCPVCGGKNPKTCQACIDLGWDKFKKDYKSFEAPQNVEQDTLIPVTLAVVQATARYIRAELWICTGRTDTLRDVTIQWLSENHVYAERLIMRPKGDHSHDHDLKAGWVDHGAIPLDRVFCVFEDRTRVVEMWRDRYGLQVYQVANGDF